MFAKHSVAQTLCMPLGKVRFWPSSPCSPRLVAHWS